VCVPQVAGAEETFKDVAQDEDERVSTRGTIRRVTALGISVSIDRKVPEENRESECSEAYTWQRLPKA